MALIHSFESDGNFLFKYRGQIPVVLFLAAIPVIYFTDYFRMDESWKCLLTVKAIVISAIGFIIRAYTIGTTPKGTSGRNTQTQVAEVLNSTGIYSVVRHPLYLGNYLMWIGIVLYTFNIYYVIIVSLAYWLYYERIMFAEERFLERKFGESYLQWSLKAPAFVPSFRKFIPSSVPFSMKTVFRREYSGVLATVLGFIFIDLVRNYFETKTFFLSRTGIIVVIVTALLALLLRCLKHYTNVLNDSDRS